MAVLWTSELLDSMNGSLAFPVVENGRKDHLFLLLIPGLNMCALEGDAEAAAP